MKKHYVVHAAHTDGNYSPEIKFYHLAETKVERDACTLLVALGIVPDYKHFGQYPADFWFNKTEVFLGRSVKDKPGFRYSLSIETK